MERVTPSSAGQWGIQEEPGADDSREPTMSIVRGQGVLRNGIIDQVIASIPADTAAATKTQLTRFINAYYEQLSNADLANFTPDDLFGAALCHWELAQSRADTNTLIRVYNPQIQEDSWQSSHTVIEIVTDDMPYLVMSLSMAVSSLGLNIHQTIHPIMQVKRSKTGKLLSDDQADAVAKAESLMHIEVDRLSDKTELATLQQTILDTLAVISSVNRDNEAMLETIESLRVDTAQMAEMNTLYSESSALLNWLDERHFAVLGTAEFIVQKNLELQAVDSAALGIFSLGNDTLDIPVQRILPPDHNVLFDTDQLVSISKATLRSPIVRPEILDVIVIRQQDSAKSKPSIYCLVGLFPPFVKHLDTSQIPVLRQKAGAIHAASGLLPNSHAGKTLTNTLEQLPREMLFQNETDTLLEISTGIVNLQERQRICLFGSVAPGGMHCNCLVYIPREHYGREIRLTIEAILLEELNGLSAEFDSQFSSESALARIHYLVRMPEVNVSVHNATPDWAAIEARVIDAAITWEDRLLNTLLQRFDENQAVRLYREYRDAFPISYKSNYSARIAQADIALIEDKMKTDHPIMHIFRNKLADTDTLSFKLFAPGKRIALSDVIPIIENMGLTVDGEHPFLIKRERAESLWMHEFSVKRIDGKSANENIPNLHLQTVFEKIWLGQVENDGFNRLILDPGLDWQQSIILRSYCKYLLQIGVPFSQTYMIDTLVNNAGITERLVQLFEERFKPGYTGDRDTAQEKSIAAIQESLSAVDSLDQDRILRAYLNLITSTLRTNFYRLDENAEPLSYVSYKLNSALVTGLPLPRPHVEIFVYSPRVEGIHLRGGKVARGGLRWSDRREDFRVEVLGLMKAQMVKNAVIVPVGSKGGFYVKKPPLQGDREAVLAEGIACYQTFLRGLLDVTDNLVGDKVVPPNQVERYDNDDPYLVVAADKGTATFSDYANAISDEYGFWLGDAFASGGSVGYDHKKMGITARGAWESVKRHFRELGSDTQTAEFTVAAVGDMAGDVFGNGMLLSTKIKLVAAFNHMHIFIDPNPDSAISHKERQRLFDLPRSSWDDYDKSLLSEGGAIYPRSMKQITLSPEAMAALDITTATLAPNELISEILRAPIDLVWNGGIGTYIKASSERHGEASDRANDSVRINATELRCKVIGEGGNLGVTQLARIEFAKQGGLMYTDAIDNSAGVDCSDHEVNIKILLNSIVKAGDMTVKQRDTLLAKMTDNVSELVLQDNYLQTQCINIVHAENAKCLEEHSRFISEMEASDKLDREIEFLPGSEEIADRLANNQGLTRPEISVLVAYSKMALYEDLLASKMPEDRSLDAVLIDYFPNQLREEFATEIRQHRLRAEIITTVVTNQLVNRLGPTFLYRMQQELGAAPAEVAHAFVAVCEIFDMQRVWDNIEALDNIVVAEIQTSMHTLARGLVERAVHWLLRSRREPEPIDVLVAYFKPGITDLVNNMPECLASANQKTLDERSAYFTNAGAPDNTALSIAQVVPLSSALDLVEISKSQQRPIAEVAAVYFELGVFLNLQWLRDEISYLTVRSHWHTLAKSELRSDIHYQQRHLCAEVLGTNESGVNASTQVANWSDSNLAAIQKYDALIAEMKAASSIDFAMLSLAVNEVHKLLRSDRPLASISG